MEKIKCNKCQEVKEATKEFFEWRKDTCKFRTQCRACVSLKKKEYYNKNSSKIKQKVHLYRINNLDGASKIRHKIGVI